MNERNFFAELKRRNVYKVAVAYAVAAWLLIQAASIFEKARVGGETPDTTWLRVDPLFDPLRNEPHFQQLVAKLFPQNP